MRSRAWFTLKGMSQQKWRWQEKSKSHNNYLFILKTETSKWFFLGCLLLYSSHSNIFSVLITPFSQIIQVKVRQMLASFSGTASYFFFLFFTKGRRKARSWEGICEEEEWEGEEKEKEKRGMRHYWDVVLSMPRSAELSLWNETLPNTHKG